MVLWGARRYDIQVGSERDLRRSQTLRNFRDRYLAAFSPTMIRYIRHGMGTGTGAQDTVWGEWGTL